MSNAAKVATPAKAGKSTLSTKTPRAAKDAKPAKPASAAKALAQVKPLAPPEPAKVKPVGRKTAKAVAPVLPPVSTAPDPEIAKLFAPPKPLEHTTEVFDEYELASMREMEATAEYVRRARLKAQIKAPEDWDGETCYDCAREIEVKRFALGYYTCIHCEREKEVRSRQFRR